MIIAFITESVFVASGKFLVITNDFESDKQRAHVRNVRFTFNEEERLHVCQKKANSQWKTVKQMHKNVVGKLACMAPIWLFNVEKQTWIQIMIHFYEL